jgi:hypothetical protein
MIQSRRNRINEIEEKYINYLENDPSVILGEMSIREVVEKCGLGPFTQYLEVLEIKPLEDYKLWCKLKTGETKIYDFTPQFECKMYEPLKDKSIFDTVCAEYGVPAWINKQTGLDIELGITWILIDGEDEGVKNEYI